MDMNMNMTLTPKSPKSKLVALLLALFGGGLGLHYFYVGRIWMGLLYLFTGGLFGIGWLFSVIQIAMGKFRDRFGFVLD